MVKPNALIDYSKVIVDSWLTSQQMGDHANVKLVVVSVSEQARASLAACYQLPVQQTAAKLTAFFKRLGLYCYAAVSDYRMCRVHPS